MQHLQQLPLQLVKGDASDKEGEHKNCGKHTAKRGSMGAGEQEEGDSNRQKCMSMANAIANGHFVCHLPLATLATPYATFKFYHLQSDSTLALALAMTLCGLAGLASFQ